MATPLTTVFPLTVTGCWRSMAGTASTRRSANPGAYLTVLAPTHDVSCPGSPLPHVYRT